MIKAWGIETELEFTLRLIRRAESDKGHSKWKS
jgi:hypothetical protein